jgi:hypothetical protein
MTIYIHYFENYVYTIIMITLIMISLVRGNPTGMYYANQPFQNQNNCNNYEMQIVKN